MSNSKYPLKVSQVRSLTADAIEISFEVPEVLQKTFEFVPGQYLTIEAFIDGKRHLRCYSICSHPKTDGSNLKVGVKRVEAGLVSNFFNDNVKAGELLSVLPPMGRFTLSTEETNDGSYLMFAGGSGITPILSMIKAILHEEPNSKILLYYANRDGQSIMFDTELNALLLDFEDRFKIQHCWDDGGDGTKVWSGLIDSEKVSKVYTAAKHSTGAPKIFMCGPGPFMKIIEVALNELGIPSQDIMKEHFVVLNESQDSADAAVEKNNSEMTDGTYKVVAILEGEEFAFTGKEPETILEAALEADIDPPYACMSASCSTCRAKLVSGEVKMDDREILSDEEIADGFILTCQSHPTTPEVKIDYDQY